MEQFVYKHKPSYLTKKKVICCFQHVFFLARLHWPPAPQHWWWLSQSTAAALRPDFIHSNITNTYTCTNMPTFSDVSDMLCASVPVFLTPTVKHKYKLRLQTDQCRGSWYLREPCCTLSRGTQDIKIGLLATLHFYLQSSINLDLCELLRAAEETKNVQKIFQFASLTHIQGLKNVKSFQRSV